MDKNMRNYRRIRVLPAAVAAATLLGVVAAGAPGAGAAGAGGHRRFGGGQIAPRATGFGSNWTVYHGNPLSTGLDPAGTTLRPMHAGWASKVLDGPLYGEPLVYGGRVVIATENDSVYELSARTGGVIWSRHYATAVPAGDLPCGDIDPVGITGTPVIDPVRHEIFVVADELSHGTIRHHLLGLNLYSGSVELDEVVDAPGSTPANQLQRPGLALDDGYVVIGYGGNDGDCNYYHGWIVGAPEAGGALRTYEVDPLPGDDEGAVWMGGGSPLVDSKGNIWFATGNGSQGDCSQPYDQSDSVTEISPALKQEQIFAPSTWCSDNGGDADLGSAAPAIVDGFVFQVGKAHIAYLMNENHLGGIGGEIEQMPLCNNDPHGGLAVSGNTVYVGCGDGVAAVSITTTSPHMHYLWTTNTGANGPPIVANGLIWSVDQGGELWGLNPANGNAVVSESTNGGEQNHFPTPAVADGLMLVPTSDQVFAYEGPAGRPPPPPPPPAGQTRYWVATAAGGIYPFGGAPGLGSLAGTPLTKPIVGMATMPGGNGYWLVASDGGVFAFGTARFHGSMGGRHLNRPIVGMAATADGAGYWLVASDGGIFTFGDAHFSGSMGGTRLTRPVVGMASQPGGPGYWLVASDGGIFAFGGAHFDGSTGGMHLTTSISGMAADPVHGGYWLVAADGGVFAFGAPYRGSLGGTPTPAPVAGIAAAPDGAGYWMVDSAGDVSAFGDAIPGGQPPPGSGTSVAIAASG